MRKRKLSVKHPNPHTEDKAKQIYFLCAMPRSGNTLFTSIINQNPEIAVTANSITLEIMNMGYFQMVGMETNQKII